MRGLGLETLVSHAYRADDTTMANIMLDTISAWEPVENFASTRTTCTNNAASATHAYTGTWFFLELHLSNYLEQIGSVGWKGRTKLSSTPSLICKQ